MSEDTKLKVIALAEHDKAFKEVGDDLLQLREHVKNVEAANGVKIDEVKDELAKSVEVLDGITSKMSDIQTELTETKRRAAANVGDKSLIDEIKSLGGGYQAPQPGEDDKYLHVGRDAKPTVKQLVEGVLLPTGKFYSPKHERLQELQELSDTVLITDALMSFANGKQYDRNGGYKALNCYKELMRMSNDIFKADGDLVDTTYITTWVPTHFSTQLFDLVKIGLPELNIFQEVVMPGKTFDLNVNLTDVTGDYIAEKSTIATMSPFTDTNSQAVTDAKVTLTAAKFRARMPFTGEADEDAIVAQIPLLRAAIIRALREAKADAILNGDSGGDLDTGGEHFGVGGPRNNPAATIDPRVPFDGLRSFALDNTATPDTAVDIAGDITAAGLLSIRETMGEFGVDPADLVNLLGYTGYLNLLGDSNLETMDKIGDRATLITGAIGAVNGSSVAVSRRMPHNMNASGIIDGVTETKTGAIVVHRGGALVGNRRRDTIGQDRYGATDSYDLYAFSRIGFNQIFGITKPWIGYGYNVST
jgi:hypothetical protein